MSTGPAADTRHQPNRDRKGAAIGYPPDELMRRAIMAARNTSQAPQAVAASTSGQRGRAGESPAGMDRSSQSGPRFPVG